MTSYNLGAVKPSKKVRVWLILLAVGVLSGALLRGSGNHTLSCAGAFGIFLEIVSCAALLLIGLVAFLGAIVRRLRHGERCCSRRNGKERKCKNYPSRHMQSRVDSRAHASRASSVSKANRAWSCQSPLICR